MCRTVRRWRLETARCWHAPKGSIVNAVKSAIPEQLALCATMSTTVIAERTGWDRSITVLREKVAQIRLLYLLTDPVSRTAYEPGRRVQDDFWFPPTQSRSALRASCCCLAARKVSGGERGRGVRVVEVVNVAWAQVDGAEVFGAGGGDRRPQFFLLSRPRARSMSCRARKSAPVSARIVRSGGEGVPGMSAAALACLSMNSRVWAAALIWFLDLVAYRDAEPTRRLSGLVRAYARAGVRDGVHGSLV